MVVSLANRRISQRTVRNIADARMSKLISMSKTAVDDGNEDRAKRYVLLASHIGQKARAPMPKNEKICKKCMTPLIAGKNCRVRIGDGRVKMTCLKCGKVKRLPYTAEQRQ